MERHLALVTRLAAAFPRDRIEKSTIITYADALLSLEIETLERVMPGVRDSCDRFPTLSIIKRAYDDERERQAWERRSQMAALPEGPSAPMPESIKAQIAEMKRKMEGRARELEPEDA